VCEVLGIWIRTAEDEVLLLTDGTCEVAVSRTAGASRMGSRCFMWRVRGRAEWHDRRNERRLAALPGEQAGSPIPRPLPHHRRSGQGSFALRKVRLIVGGIAVANLLLAPLQGPGWGTFLVGLVILAGELFILARFLDRAEMKLRGPARRAKVVWASYPPL
jgi:hypothetical protein